LSLEQSSESVGEANGAALGLGTGYEFWIADQRSCGPGVQLDGAPLRTENEQHRFFSAVLAVTFTNH
jgi:hypothetical protein